MKFFLTELFKKNLLGGGANLPPNQNRVNHASKLGTESSLTVSFGLPQIHIAFIAGCSLCHHECSIASFMK